MESAMDPIDPCEDCAELISQGSTMHSPRRIREGMQSCGSCKLLARVVEDHYLSERDRFSLIPINKDQFAGRTFLIVRERSTVVFVYAEEGLSCVFYCNQFFEGTLLYAHAFTRIASV